MSASDVEKIALYLNLAYSKIYDAGGKLTFLTGKDSPSIDVDGGSQNQETQIMAVGGAIWIANNDDGITTTMQSFCEQLEIKSVTRLVKHVDAFATRALEYNPVTKAPELGRSASTHSKVLAWLIASEEGVEPKTLRAAAALDTGTITTANSAQISKYTLGGSGPKGFGIVFVHGVHRSVDKYTSQHAEQKLLAALGEFGSHSSTSTYVAGCKAPCAVCGRVLAAVQLKVPRLRYMNPEMVSVRSNAGLGPYTPSNIASLDVNSYF